MAPPHFLHSFLHRTRISKALTYRYCLPVKPENSISPFLNPTIYPSDHFDRESDWPDKVDLCNGLLCLIRDLLPWPSSSDSIYLVTPGLGFFLHQGSKVRHCALFAKEFFLLIDFEPHFNSFTIENHLYEDLSTIRNFLNPPTPIQSGLPRPCVSLGLNFIFQATRRSAFGSRGSLFYYFL